MVAPGGRTSKAGEAVKVAISKTMQVTWPDDRGVETLEPGVRQWSPEDAHWIIANWGYDREIVQATIAHAEPGDTVAVVRDQGLGDVLMVTPVVRAYHQRGLVVHVYSSELFGAVFENNPYVTQLHIAGGHLGGVASDCEFTVNLCEAVERDRRYGEINRTALFADIAMAHLDSRKPDYFATPGELEDAEARWGSPRPRVAVVPRASANPARAWPFMQEFAEGMAREGCNVGTLCRSPEESFATDAIRNFGGIGLRPTIALLATADVCVTPDTGLLYAAVAVNCPVVAIFGCWEPRLRVEGYERVTVLDANALLHRPYCYDSMGCDGRQMRAVTADMVAEATRRVLQG